MKKVLRRRTGSGRFTDRRDAGRALAGLLRPYRGRTDLVVLGLARGGIPVGWHVAAALHAPFDAFLVRKLGAPDQPELAMGALAGGGGLVLNTEVMRSRNVSDSQLQATIRAETAELHRREHVYRGDRPPPELAGRTVILVDDGVATGASMFAAVRGVRATGCESVVVAVPVGTASTCQALRAEADAVLCVCTPPDFSAVGQLYDDFRQTGDDEVRRLLATPT
ncbi:phosphoribosyltransferase [Mycolicibacterium sp. J2]|jgi:predicted phosphoribosyltransferase|uniref:phosphoribosyltransferase n=1 Tax=Mycolicibacterium sp. J2 TaxID=2993511 RepID=UPI00224A6427|nr:phosphoribosyltransferase [Mycolicibacterium sp. J2]MCX2713918.1 phosphoribosyltransferase [Mycolicibacterium sp. J2]